MASASPSTSPTDSPVEIRWKKCNGLVSRHGRRRSLGGAGDHANRYGRTELIKNDNFASVFRGCDLKHDMREVIIKTPNKLDGIKSEIGALTRLEHESVVTLLDFYLHKGATVLVLDFVHGQDLFDWLVEFHASPRRHKTVEATIQPIVKQIVIALVYCHSQGVAHRDVKLENIRINPETHSIRLIDFGLSYIACANMDSQLRCGTPEYAAPELTDGNKEIDPYKTDVWSTGVLTFSLAHNSFPFDGYGGETLHLSHKFSRGFRRFVRAMLVRDPYRRPDMETLSRFEWLEN